MAIIYKVIARPNPQDRTAPKKFYATAVSSGDSTLKKFGKRLEKRSGVSSIDVNAVLQGLLELMVEDVVDGETIRLGEFGSFAVTVSSEGSEKEEDVSSANIRGVKIVFRPGKDLKNALKTASFKKIS